MLFNSQLILSILLQNANDRQSVKVNPSPLVDVSASASPSVELPFFFGFPGAFPAFYVAIEDLILYNPSLSTRAKYRKIFFSLYVYDQILLSEAIDPASPDLALALRLLKERYEPFCEKGLYKPEKFPRSLSVASAEVASGAAQDGISSTAATTTNATIGSNSTQHMKYALKPTTTTSFNQSDSMYSKHSNKYSKSFY